MTTETTPAGAMPVAASAMLAQSYPFGPWFAPYRMRRPGMNGVVDPRAVGITFEGDSGSGSDSGAAGSGDDGSDKGGKPDTKPDASATDEAALGDAGKRALQVERDARKVAEDRAKAAERERDDLKLATASDTDKAIAAAKADGKTEIIERLHTSVRRTAVREALLTAGAVPSLVADLSRADEFATLKVNDDDEIDRDGLEKAVKAHKARVPDAYRTPGDSGSADGGARGSGKGRSDSLEDSIAAHYEGKA